MAKIKRLRSVIQSIAHHAISGVCYLHPHLGEQCNKDGLNLVTLDLINGGLKPILSEESKEIKLSTKAILEKLHSIMNAEGIEKTYLNEATATFRFDNHNWARYCHVKAITINGEKLEAIVTSMGEVGKIIEKYS